MISVKLYEIQNNKDMFVLSAILNDNGTLRLSGIDFCSLAL